ncbi:polyphenol oxidase I [Forsythia ovata]|uniref:Polyphenol oxidase I n=1 Tax=Forsythia ovata TaxID=205694 RepID=A0ABD1WJZ2_9LAMI
MASLSAMGYATNYIPCSTSFFPKKPPQFNNRRRNPVVKFTCKAKNGETSPGKFDRRDVLLGLGGLYSTSLAANPMALANPVFPDYKNCIDAKQPNKTPINCCPPPVDPSRVENFFPSATTVNIRKPAHSFVVDSDYYKKYTSAIIKMKNLLPLIHAISGNKQMSIAPTAMKVTLNREVQSCFIVSIILGCFSHGIDGTCTFSRKSAKI